jgi:hypothetical protein
MIANTQCFHRNPGDLMLSMGWLRQAREDICVNQDPHSPRPS